ncbi:MAG: helix-turn-helix domain-containing protein, partial [Lachnospiraceae bacterium]|nr:helix-turn-helix domain-containing protein [Lachnospiraceae bacterium]
MEFNELLNQYMDQIPCSAKDLSLTSGISASAISRYRSGQRTPSKEDLQNLSESLCRIAEDNGSEIDPDKLRTSLYASLPNLDVDRVSFTGKFSLLMQTLPINRKQLSEYAGYDPSFLSKILSGDRAPSDFVSFATSISDFTAEFCIREGHLNLLGDLIKENVSDIQEESAISKVLCAWLLAKDGTESREKSEQDAIHSFLKKLDDFDLNDYMKRIHFDKIPTPTSPLRATGNKNYTGIEGMKKAEIEFLKRTSLSSSKEPLWQYSSLPMEELAK